MTLTEAAAALADKNADSESRKAAREVVTAAIVEIVAKRPTTAPRIRAALKKAGAVVHTTTIRVLAVRAAHKGLIKASDTTGVSYAETEFRSV